MSFQGPKACVGGAHKKLNFLTQVEPRCDDLGARTWLFVRKWRENSREDSFRCVCAPWRARLCLGVIDIGRQSFDLHIVCFGP